MRSKLVILVIVLAVTNIYYAKAQGFKPPAEGKAVVYFSPIWFGGKEFKYFHNDVYFGTMKGKNYLRYECDPGQHLFWASSENIEFITADLKENGTYLVIVSTIFGTGKAHVGFEAFDNNREKYSIWAGMRAYKLDRKEVLKKAKKIIDGNPPVQASQSEIETENTKLKEFIKEQLVLYHDEWKETRNYKSLTPEMAIPSEELK